MKKTLIAVVAALGMGSCVAHERTVVREHPASACAGGVWIEGHYGPHGVWHDGHWRCPGAVEVIEVG